MPRKSNKTRKDGRIAVKVYIGRDADGKHKYKFAYGKTQKEADAKANEIRFALRKGIDLMADKDSFREWGDYWFKLKSESGISKSQVDVCSSVKKHLDGHLGDASITKMKTADLQIVISNYAKKNPNTKKPASQKFLKTMKEVASQIFRCAIENRVLEYNPAEAIKIPTTTPPQSRRALTEKEQAWIVESRSDHKAKRAAMIMMYAGLRRGELIPLTWNDIDLENQTITINKAVEKESNKFILKNYGKTDTSMRTVGIPLRLAEYLKGEAKSTILVCTDADDSAHTPSSWKRMWESYLTELNLKHGDFSPFEKHPKSKFDPEGVPFVIQRITPHWLRHTFATMLYFAGVDVLTAKEQLGHKDIKTTLSIYTHLDQKHKRKEMNKLDKYLGDVEEENPDNGSHMGVSENA